MTAPVVTFDAVVLCAHGGTAVPAAASARVRVQGVPIVGLATTYVIAGCTNHLPDDTPQPCVTATWTSGATRVRADGLPIVLSDGQAVCVPTGTGLLIPAPQQRVRAS